ncbi:MAG: hypothetical protein R3D55_26745 [Chloroflexota bacterium]
MFWASRASTSPSTFALAPGAYICGEETALFEAIEGKRGFPRIKPPFPPPGLFDPASGRKQRRNPGGHAGHALSIGEASWDHRLARKVSPRTQAVFASAASIADLAYECLQPYHPQRMIGLAGGAARR